MSATYENPEPIDVEQLPLDAWHRATGARMVPFAGYAMPIQYDGIIAEHLWTRENAGMFDVSHMGQLTVSGPDAGGELEKILPSDINGLAVHKVRYSLLLDDTGGVLDDLMVTNLGTAFGLIVNGATKWDDIGYLREQLPDDVTINHLDDAGLLALQGPAASLALARLIPSVTDLGFMDFASFPWEGVTLGISRSGYTGEDGFEISVPATHVERLATALCEQPEVKPAGLGARDSLRLEAGLPLYGHDLNATIDPVTACLTFAIQKRRRVEGGFAGAQSILPAFTSGTPTKRVGLLIDGRQPAREGADVYSGGDKVGALTSGGYSPSLQRPIAMGYVASSHAAPGTALEVDVRGNRLKAIVTTLPFVPHRYHRKGAA